MNLQIILMMTGLGSFWAGYFHLVRTRFISQSSYLFTGIGLCLVGVSLIHVWPIAVFDILLGVIHLLIWWNNSRRNRKRIKEMLGAKSKALRDKIVRNLRESLKPRKVLQPSPTPI